MSWAFAGADGIVIAYAGLSRFLERTPVSAPIFCLSAGLLVGSKGLGWIDLAPTSEQVRVFETICRFAGTS